MTTNNLRTALTALLQASAEMMGKVHPSYLAEVKQTRGALPWTYVSRRYPGEFWVRELALTEQKIADLQVEIRMVELALSPQGESRV